MWKKVLLVLVLFRFFFWKGCESVPRYISLPCRLLSTQACSIYFFDKNLSNFKILKFFQQPKPFSVHCAVASLHLYGLIWALQPAVVFQLAWATNCVAVISTVTTSLQWKLIRESLREVKTVTFFHVLPDIDVNITHAGTPERARPGLEGWMSKQVLANVDFSDYYSDLLVNSLETICSLISA